MSLSITEAMQQAQDAISGGNYRAAVTAATQLVKQFPSWSAAHRLLGEAYLEQGQSQDAERAFVAALASNPRQPWAYLGLGLIAEDRGSADNALAYCQVAWELSPTLSQLREPVARVAARRYGADGQLQLTRAALATLHADASRLRRAANEYRAALADLPERVDLRLGLAEALWRLGEDDEAARLARQTLDQQPEAVQALVILSDLEYRNGAAQAAGELRDRLRAVDPDGAVTEQLLQGHDQAVHDFLLLPPDAIPSLSEQADAVVAERPHIAPAPDFAYEPSLRPEPAAPRPDLADLRPISAEEFGRGAEDAATPASFGARTGHGDLGFEDFSEEPFAPFDPAELGQPASGARPAPFDAIVDDDLASLAAALEGDVADALNRAGEPASPSAGLEPFDLAMYETPVETTANTEPDAHVPPAQPPRGYTTVLRELDSAGLAPFDAMDRSASTTPSDTLSASTPSDADVDRAIAETTIGATDELTRMNQQWDSIDSEIHDAVPWETQRGFTDQLRSLEEIGLEPFQFDDGDTEQGDVRDGEHTSTTVNAQRESLAPANAAQPPARTVPEPRPGPPAAEAEPADDSFGDLQPFAFEDFSQEDSAERPATSQLPWEGPGGRSAVPSDADLEALLAVEDEPPVTPPVVGESSASSESVEAAPIPADSDNFEQFIHSTLAATRALTGGPGRADGIAGAAPQAGAEAEVEPAAIPENVPVGDAAHRELAATDSLFERVRVAKDQLVAEGVIAGNREMDVEQAAAERTAIESDAEPDAPSPLTDVVAMAEPTPDTFKTVATRDTTTLRSALAADPNDAELRWWLGEALRERGDYGEALTEYRWLIRHAPEHHDAVLQALGDCVERGQQPEMAHRLLADLYRRRGDVARASNHAARALQQRQRDAQGN